MNTLLLEYQAWWRQGQELSTALEKEITALLEQRNAKIETDDSSVFCYAWLDRKNRACCVMLDDNDNTIDDYVCNLSTGLKAELLRSLQEAL